MLQLLCFLHKTPMVILPKVFCEVNSIFRMLLWHRKAPRVKLKHLQRPKNEGSLAMPNPWLYYMAAQLQHLIASMNKPGQLDAHLTESTVSMLLYVTRVEDIPTGPETLAFSKSNRLLPT